MLELVKSIIPIARNIDKRADITATLMNRTWVMFSPDGNYSRVVFRSNNRMVTFRQDDVIEGTWEIFEELPSVVMDSKGEKRNFDIYFVDNGFIILGVAELHNWKYALVEVSQLPNSMISEDSVAQFLYKKFEQMSNNTEKTRVETTQKAHNHAGESSEMKSKRSLPKPKMKASKKKQLLIADVVLNTEEKCSFHPPLGEKDDWNSFVTSEVAILGPDCGKYFFDYDSSAYCVVIGMSATGGKEVVGWFKMIHIDQPDGEGLLVGRCMYTDRVKRYSPVTDLKKNAVSGVFKIDGYLKRVKEGILISI